MTEKKVLVVCVFTTGAFAIPGLVWGLVASSSMILFGGTYSAISLLLSLQQSVFNSAFYKFFKKSPQP